MADITEYGFTTPHRKPPTADAFDVRPRKVHAWVEALPLTNITESAKRLAKVLYETNRTQIKAEDRFKMLEILREPAEFILTSLEKYYLGQPIPLDEKASKVVAFTRQMLDELGMGYKCILEDFLDHPKVKLSQKELAVCLYRPLTYLGRQLLIGYQAYGTPPAIWREVNVLYRLAEQFELETREFIPEHPTLAHAYARIALLALSDPHALSQYQMTRLYQSLEQWSAFCPLMKADALPLESSALYFVDLASEQGPQIARRHALPTGGDPRFFDTRDLSDVIRMQLAEQNPDAVLEHVDQPNHTTLSRLITVWQGQQQRHFDRTPRDGEIVAQISLNAIHDALNPAEAAVKSEPAGVQRHDRLEHFLGSLEGSALSPVAPQAWESDINTRISANIHFQTTDTTPPSAPRPQPVRLKVLDQSRGGLRLRLSQTKAMPRLMVGDLISVSLGNATGSSDTEIGSIKWLRRRGEQEVDCGIQLLASSVIPAQGIDARHARNVACLVLPRMPELNQPSSLVTPIQYHSADRITLKLDGKSLPLKLGKAIEHNEHYARFYYHEVP
ncbi:MAG: hypothetical protein AB1810_02170 [Pseudomonadota bacterium]